VSNVLFIGSIYVLVDIMSHEEELLIYGFWNYGFS